MHPIVPLGTGATARSQGTREAILAILRDDPAATFSDLAHHVGISRQAVARQARVLQAKDQVTVVASGRNRHVVLNRGTHSFATPGKDGAHGPPAALVLSETRNATRSAIMETLAIHPDGLRMTCLLERLGWNATRRRLLFHHIDRLRNAGCVRKEVVGREVVVHPLADVLALEKKRRSLLETAAALPSRRGNR